MPEFKPYRWRGQPPRKPPTPRCDSCGYELDSTSHQTECGIRPDPTDTPANQAARRKVLLAATAPKRTR